MDEPARARLAAWLSAAAGAPVSIAGMGLLSGGAVQQNWALDVTLGGTPQRWVLRTDNAAVLAVSHPRTAEFALLQAAHAAGVAVPAPLFCCTTRDVTGAPFFVMQRVEGIAAGHRLVRAAQGTALAEALGRELARIHSIHPPRADLPFLGDPPADAHAAFIAAQRAALDAAGTPRPVLEWGLRHLERTAPPPGETVLNHNDFRTGNYMAQGDRVSAVLDWDSPPGATRMPTMAGSARPAGASARWRRRPAASARAPPSTQATRRPAAAPCSMTAWCGGSWRRPFAGPSSPPTRRGGTCPATPAWNSR
ncbi:phosphotransferase family protein [Dankookia sp. P2]|uniref:phosphotransferase family protein n=1 Tax=Dankookia sp. P2 TaxID=3423955 RepID=UPI003D66C5F4